MQRCSNCDCLAGEGRNCAACGHALSAPARAAMPQSEFGVPSKAPGPGSYPMPDRKHAVVAEGLAAMHNDPHKEAIDAKARKILGS